MHKAMKKLLILLFIAFSFQSYAQNEAPNDEQWEVVDRPANFPRGMGAFYKYVRKNMEYPPEAKNNKVKGKVFVSFVVDSTGFVRKETVKAIQGIGYGCDAEAVRLVKESPKWNPGRISKLDKDVPVRMVLPIEFKK